jgi:hypothetical protein
MADLMAIYRGCEPLVLGNGGDYWSSADGALRVAVSARGLTREGDHVCTVAPDTEAVLMSQSGRSCRSFRALHDLRFELYQRGCPTYLQAPDRPASQRLVSVTMRPLPVGTHADVTLRLHATIDPARGTINGSSGQGFRATYSGTVTVRPHGTGFIVDLDLARRGDTLHFPRALQTQVMIERHGQLAGAVLLTLPMEGQGTGRGFTLAPATTVPTDAFLAILDPTAAGRAAIRARATARAATLHTSPHVIIEHEVFLAQKARLHAAGLWRGRIATATSFTQLAAALDLPPYPASVDHYVARMLLRSPAAATLEPSPQEMPYLNILGGRRRGTRERIWRETRKAARTHNRLPLQILQQRLFKREKQRLQHQGLWGARFQNTRTLADLAEALQIALDPAQITRVIDRFVR